MGKAEGYVPYTLKKMRPAPKGAPRVFSTFACGGGSSIGYKLAGFEVVGANDIDPDMMDVYRRNLRPKVERVCPVADLIGDAALRKEIGELDVLDGSPPCSTFSMAGVRERKWGRKSHFREGQATQNLDRLFFDLIALAAEWRPKVVIAENVKGIILGRAMAYSQAIVRDFGKAGYDVQVFLLNAADYGVPQSRERVFFVCRRKDLKLERLRMPEKRPRTAFIDAIKDLGRQDAQELREGTRGREMWDRKAPGESLRDDMTGEGFGSSRKANQFRPLGTVTASAAMYHWSEPRLLSAAEVARAGSFPDDYDFMPGRRRPEVRASYIVGMSVPPRMMEAVAGAVRDQWLRGK